MSATKRMPYTITENMEEGLRQVNKQTGIPIAKLVRMGIVKILLEHGVHVEDEVRQGGLREKAVEQPAGMTERRDE